MAVRHPSSASSGPLPHLFLRRSRQQHPATDFSGKDVRISFLWRILLTSYVLLDYDGRVKLKRLAHEAIDHLFRKLDREVGEEEEEND